MSDEPVVVREVFTTASGEVCDRDDPNAVAVEVVWLDANGEEHRTYADVSGASVRGAERCHPCDVELSQPSSTCPRCGTQYLF